MKIWQRVAATFGPKTMLKLVRFYPPFFGAGIVVVNADAALRFVEVEMKLTPFNRNYVGTHFGGSLYAMVDPFFMLMMMQNLGDAYVVWDKSASIDFKRPGKTTVRARFEITDAQLQAIKDEVARDGKAHPRFSVDIVDTSGEVVARVGKVLSVRLKK